MAKLLKKRKFLSHKKVLSLIKRRMRTKRPLSLVRVGDGENIVLAQQGVWPIRKVLRTKWAKKSRRSNKKGVSLPNMRLRNQMIRALRRASIVGIPHRKERQIKAKRIFLRPLTEKNFRKYKIKPRHVCHTFINRHLPEKKEFWDMLKGKRVILISKWAKQFRRYVKNNYPKHRIRIIPISFSNYNQINRILKRVKPIKADIVLVSTGVNALVLVDQLARTQRRVAIDFGKAPMLILKRDKRVRPWKPRK
ncbi:hypothetical protein BEP19_10730 [Ammoniphilus oxalaticus]|uniref:GT-D fold-like domain-containing protein n=1 Tax=Ammoniphilus oxalaticus TaxID=66863 RepID=A0A419SG13_9BACL|nr:GT-D fold domain-containing glycosyltransferase [Ammoniphilus oxalaticus]RKD22720.1 hypothetical protein BEP19_10730 [Ammoniphilus oxalaticus]